MTSRLITSGCVVMLLGTVWAVSMRSVTAQGPDVGTEAQRESGKKLYLKFCSQCHGDNGDGEGYAAAHLRPRCGTPSTGGFSECRIEDWPRTSRS